MPKGRRNVENVPRGICVCGGPTIAIEDEYQRNRRMVCLRCRKPSEACECSKAIPEFCPMCGERLGSRADGYFFQPSMTQGHVCPKR